MKTPKLDFDVLERAKNITAFVPQPPAPSQSDTVLYGIMSRIEAIEQSLVHYAPFVLQAAKDTETLNVVVQMLRRQHGSKFETKFSEAWRELYAPKPDNKLVEENDRLRKEIAALKEALVNANPVEDGVPD